MTSPCKNCHESMDPFGLMFENYDAIGRYRQELEGAPIDPSVSLDGARLSRHVRGRASTSSTPQRRARISAPAWRATSRCTRPETRAWRPRIASSVPCASFRPARLRAADRRRARQLGVAQNACGRMTMQYRFKRRSFLAGIGAAVGLASLLRRVEEAEAQALAPQRILFVQRPVGTVPQNWFPQRARGKASSSAHPAAVCAAARSHGRVRGPAACPPTAPWAAVTSAVRC